MVEEERFVWSVMEVWLRNSKTSPRRAVPVTDGYADNLSDAIQAGVLAVVDYLHPIIHGKRGVSEGEKYWVHVAQSPSYIQNYDLSRSSLGKIIESARRKHKPGSVDDFGKSAWELQCYVLSKQLSFEVSIIDQNPPYLSC